MQIVLVLIALGLVAVSATGLSIMRERMTADRIEKVRSVGHLAVGYAQSLEEEVKAGRMTRPAAMAMFVRQIHTVRFGAPGDYLAVEKNDGMVVAHGGNPALEGHVSQSHDKAGHSVAELMTAALTDHDDGVIRYQSVKAGTTPVMRDKLSAVFRFAPWNVNFLVGTWTDDVEADFAVYSHRLAAASLAIFVVMMAIVWAINTDIGRAIAALRGSMTALAGGDLDAGIEGLDCGAEIGGMAQSVEVFRDSMRETARLQAEQAVLKQRAEAASAQARADLAARFEASVAGIAAAVAEAACGLQATAGSLAAISDETNLQSQDVSTASARTTANVQTVATATEELSASIREIGSQIGLTTKLIEGSVRKTQDSDAQVRMLTGTAEKIGNVVSMIQDIASQTNLLALNATIEAARAGEAGRGFAVVASEVKTLATQTTKATEDIAAQINAIQTATHETARMIQGLTQAIGKVNETASAIAAAVEEQEAATREISRSVTHAARGTQEVFQSIGKVSGAARQTGDAAAEMLGAATRLSSQGGLLKDQVQNFLREIRAA